MVRNAMQHIRTVISTFLLLGILVPALHAQGDPAAGKELYTACAACHKIKGKLVGPQLGGINEKYAGDEEWLYKWIKNAPGMIQAGDSKAVALWEENNKAAMSAFTYLSDGDIDNILAYVAVEWEKLNAPVEVAGAPTGGGGGTGIDDPSIYYALLGLVAILLLIALLLVVITGTLIASVRAKENKEPVRFAEIFAQTRAILQNKFAIVAMTIFIVVGGGAKWIAEARTIGLHQGYMPEQPIAFSHAIHAGEYEIDCKYCHTGTTKSKSAWIPSVNICMNCHKGIRNRHESDEAVADPEYISPEIAKIYAAVGWDADQAAYIEGYEEKAIEWVRIHNMPDHAYFNHAQHVVVGGIECQTCHGPVEEMEVVYQYSDLGMGWCISCHREEKVKVLGEPTDKTVAEMGGLNCAACHY
ncbi:MAG: hypothetical protein GFH27_549397n34 [Chloroflexi bacterium AL-W]|nr:hypothetical protein [Chloroflexi bacterium AL-W]